MFTLLKSAPFMPTGKVGSLFVSPREWSRIFPRPSQVWKTSRATDGKADRIWRFSLVEGTGGSPPIKVDVYAYGLTSLYDPDLPDPEVFWAGEKPVNLSIAAKNVTQERVLEFTRWLKTVSGATILRAEPGMHYFRYEKGKIRDGYA